MPMSFKEVYTNYEKPIFSHTIPNLPIEVTKFRGSVLDEDELDEMFDASSATKEFELAQKI